MVRRVKAIAVNYRPWKPQLCGLATFVVVDA
jgi:hypothetical protein